LNCKPQTIKTNIQNCFQIKKSQELIDHLKTHENIDVLYDFEYQLQTNYGYIYSLKDGQVAFIPNNLRDNALLFINNKCLDQFVKADKFPIENPGTLLYDTEIDRIKTINKQINFYHNHLNTVLKFNFSEINRSSVQAYLKKIIGRTIKKLTTNTDLIGLIAVFGEVIRKEINGTWVIEKWYGTYNPYFKPRILTADKKLIFIDDMLLVQLKWEVSQTDSLFNKTEGLIDLKTRNKYHKCKILKD
jgi:hypothetical protein